jgi:hypothetical protein
MKRYKSFMKDFISLNLGTINLKPGNSTLT